MAKISTYPILSNPTTNDILIGTDVEDLNITKNFSIGSIIGIIGNQFVPYVGATGNVNLGAFNITASSFIVAGGTASQFLKANGTLDSTVYVPSTRTLTINSVTFDLSANRSWDLNTINSLTTTGTSGPATYIGKTLNIPQYQAQGNYITQLSGEATAMGPGNATVTLSNLAVISKILTGLNITGGTIVDTDSILTAFGKVQNQLNGLTGGVTYQGTWNAATNTPTLTSSVGTKGYYYVVNVAGTTNLNGITDWQLGDWAIFNGSVWEKVDNTDAVVSVNGYTGAVVLTFSDVGAPPATRNLTINGVQFDLTADRTWTVGDVRTDQSYANPTWITSLAWTKITGTPTTLAGYGITDGVSSSRTLTINGVTYDLTADRSWSVGTVTSVGTIGPLTGGTITGSGTIGITQSGASSDGYLSSTDWNTFNNKQNALTNPVTGTGTIFTLPMWSGATSLVDSPLSYGPDTFNFQYNSATGGTVNFTNIGLTAYTYSIQMNNFGSPRSTVHSYTDGVVVQSIAGTQVSRLFANGNFILGDGVVDNGHKLSVEGNVYIETIANATVDTDKFIVSDGGVIKYRTGSELLSDIGAQGALTLTTTGTSGAATLIGNVLNIPQYTDQFVGTVTSVGLSMPAAFTVSNSPVTSAGTLTVVGAGTATQYVRGDGTLGDFPSGGGGGGSSVSYYLNGSINQGTFAGNTYYEMSKVPVFGAGTDFNIATNGYISQFITDANDPESLLIPAGNWNFEIYFSASSAGGTPSFYVELYKYDGTTFTLIADNSANPEFIAFGTTVSPYFSPLAVPETVLAITDRLAIRIYVNNSGKTITLHTENSNLCQIITTFTTGLTALNGLTKQVQYLTTGTSGTDFNIASSVATHTFNLPTASAVNRGALSAADWATFNGKQSTVTLTTTGTSGPATFIANTLNIPNYTTDLSGYVTLNTSQTITASKSFTAGLILASEGSGNQNTVFRNTASIHSGSGGSNIFGFNNSNNIYFGKGLSNGGVLQWSNSAVRYYTLQDGDGTLAFLSDIPSLAGYVTLATDQTITGLKTIMRVGAAIDVLNFKIDTSNIYALKVAYNQNELAPSGEATWSLVNTFNNGSGTGLTTTPISFFRGVLVTGERLLSASVNSNLLDYYGNNPAGRYPIYAYNTGVQQFASSIIVGETTGVVNAVTGVISDLPAGVVANFKGRVIGSNAVNSNEFVTLSQIGGLGAGTVTSVAALTLGTTGTDLSSTVANSTTTPVITLNVPTASAVNRGALSSADWTTFNSKIGGTIATGQVAFGTAANTVGGDNGLFWDNANKRLGVGTNAPNSALTIVGASNYNTILLRRDNTINSPQRVGILARNFGNNQTFGIIGAADVSGVSNDIVIGVDGTVGANLITFRTASTYNSSTTERWQITSTGILQSNGAQTIQTSTGNLTLATAGGNGNILLTPNGTGNVGINNSAPSVALEVSGVGASGVIRSLRTTAAGALSVADHAGRISLGTSSGSAAFIGAQIGILADATWTAGTSQPSSFVISNVSSGTTLTEKLRVYSTGNVLIQNGGTFTDAGFRLDVNGTGRFTGNLIADSSVGIGTTSLTGYSLVVGKNITGAENAQSIRNIATIQSDVTGYAVMYNSIASTAAASFTNNTLVHYYSQQGTIGLGSAVTFQYGFLAESSLIGATNNYGFFGAIAAGTGRWNLYMNGTANNYLAGGLGIGSTSLTGCNLIIGKNITGATTAFGVNVNGQIQSDVTANTFLYTSTASTQATTFATHGIRHFYSRQGTFGAGSSVFEQFAFYADSNLIGATTNYGFFGNIPAGSNRWNLYMNGTANNYLAGSLGIGATSLVGRSLSVTKNITGAVTSYGIISNGQIQSDATSSVRLFNSVANTVAASFTLSSLVHYYTEQVTFGAGSTVTNQYGFYAESNLTGATNNYGFFGNIASGTNRWNLYMNGTANNYLAGNLLVGTTTDAGFKLDVNGTGRFTNSTSGNAFTIGTTYAGGRNIQIGVSDGSVLPTASAYINDNTGVGVYIGDNSASTKGLYVKYGGNVLIGTTTDSGGKLQLGGFSGAVNQNNGIKLTNNVGTTVGLEVGGSNDSYIGTISASNFSIRTANTPILTVSSGGNVLIGTTTDSGGKLRVDGDIFINNSSNAQIGFNTTGALNTVGAYQYFNRSSVNKWTAGMGPADGSDNYQIVTGGVKALQLIVTTGAATFASSVTANGNFELTSGANRQIIIGSVTNYNYRLKTDGDDFAISEAGNTDRLRYSYTNVRWTITGGLTVSGSLSKGSGSFKIDHPLPEKKDTHQLVHSFIEGPQADNIYRGKVKLVDGYAEVNIDEVSKMTEGTFVLLNGNVQCFTSNESGWTSIKGRIDSNILIIESEDSECTDTVSWLVIGERHDQHMIDTDWTDKNGKVIVEPLKK